MAKVSINSMMKAFAQDTVEFAQEQYRTKLDYSEQSIKKVERILSQLHPEIPRTKTGKLSKRGSVQGTVDALCNMFGGYVGEVIRRKYGGRWKIESMASGGPLVCLKVGGVHMFPPAKVYKRLVDGPGDDLWFYYRAFKQMLKEVEGA